MKISSLKKDRVSRSSEKVGNNRQERKKMENRLVSGNKEKRVKSTMVSGRYFQE
jgi:hypothetical protein